jgi:hypothetical protein
VPLKSGRDVLVSGNYQAGIWVLNITDPANPETIAWSDPPPEPPIVQPPTDPQFCNTAPQRCPLTGSWSAHWYNRFIYESHIGEGLNVFSLRSLGSPQTIQLDRLNPQTQEFSLRK